MEEWGWADPWGGEAEEWVTRCLEGVSRPPLAAFRGKACTMVGQWEAGEEAPWDLLLQVVVVVGGFGRYWHTYLFHLLVPLALPL